VGLEAETRSEVIISAPRVLEVPSVVEREEIARRAVDTLAPKSAGPVIGGVLGRLSRIERPIILGVHVAAHREAMREPAERLIVRREANGRTVVVGVVLDVVP